MYTLVRKEEVSLVELFWTRKWNKKTKSYGELPHEPIRTEVTKVIYMDVNGNLVSKGYEDMKKSVDTQLENACKDLSDDLRRTYGVRGVDVLSSKFSIEHVDEKIEYIGEKTGKVRMLNI